MPPPVWRRPWASVFYGFAGAALTVAALERARPEAAADRVADHITSTARQLAEANAAIEELRREVAALAAAPDPDAVAVSRRIARLDTMTADIRARQERIEAAIMADPATLLQVPLLHREIENLRASQLQNVEGLRKEMDRVFTFAQWVIGGLAGALFSLIIAVIGGAMGVRRSSRDNQERV